MQNNAFIRVLSDLAKAFIKIKCNFNLLPPGSNDLGYTYIDRKIGSKDKIAQIFLNPEHRITQGMSEIDKYMFAFGVAVHELLHQKYTNFSYSETRFRRVNDKIFLEIFKTMDNIFEDSRIEFFANQCFGGRALKRLKFAIQKTWELSGDITGLDEPNQIIAALIQYGDTGKVKGTFATTKAEATFAYIVENYFEPAAHNPVGSESTDLAYAATEYFLQQYPAPKGIEAPARHQTSGTGENARAQAKGNADQQKKQAQRNKTLAKAKQNSQQSQQNSQQQSGNGESGSQKASSQQNQSGGNGQEENGSNAADGSESGSGQSSSGSENSDNGENGDEAGKSGNASGLKAATQATAEQAVSTIPAQALKAKTILRQTLLKKMMTMKSMKKQPQPFRKRSTRPKLR